MTPEGAARAVVPTAPYLWGDMGCHRLRSHRDKMELLTEAQAAQDPVAAGPRSLDVGVGSLPDSCRLGKVGQVKLACSLASTTPNARRYRR
jgi:hypothetical protein